MEWDGLRSRGREDGGEKKMLEEWKERCRGKVQMLTAS